VAGERWVSTQAAEAKVVVRQLARTIVPPNARRLAAGWARAFEGSKDENMIRRHKIVSPPLGGEHRFGRVASAPADLGAACATSDTRDDEEKSDVYDFSLILGGPLYQLFCRAHLSGKVLELLRRRVLVLCGIAWIPLLVFSVLEGNAWGRAVKVPFLLDPEVYARFFLALPLLIIAELVIHQRMRTVVRQFLERDLIGENMREKFDRAIASAFRLRNSVVAEVLLIAIVYVIDVLVIWRGHMVLDVGSWSSSFVNGEPQPTGAGWWYRCVSLPVLQFLLLRWYYRLFIWARFLWHVSRLNLKLIATHPDHSAGLGFLAQIGNAFGPLLVAQGALVAGMIADRIFFAGAKLPQFRVELVALAVVAILIVVGPLLVFAPKLARVRRSALREYGAFAQRYVSEFEHKWLRGGAAAADSPLGSGDIQSLADLGNSFEAIRQMRSIPFTPRALVQLAIVALAPVAPLVLTMISAEELFKRLIKVVF
jgi:hypothetical protein